MKDLVETVIGQVMRQGNAYVPASAPESTQGRMPGVPAHRVQHLSQAGDPRGVKPSEHDPLWRASRQFEALFVEQMLSSMRKAIPDSGLLKKGFAEDVSTSMMDQAVADSIGKQGRMGIATSLYRQLSNAYPAQEHIQVNAETGDKQFIPLTRSRTGEEGDKHGTH